MFVIITPPPPPPHLTPKRQHCICLLITLIESTNIALLHNMPIYAFSHVEVHEVVDAQRLAFLYCSTLLSTDLVE